MTDTLGSPYVEEEWLAAILDGPIAESRRQANRSSGSEPITVVIGNPPYKEKAKGRGGWIEYGGASSREPAPLQRWMPPADWGVGAHAKHLRNLYVYFWRWATWKVFDHDPKANTGIVCFITVAGFLNGPGFEKMRDYLRRDADRHLGHRLLARRPPARRPDADLSGRAAAGLHRAGVARSEVPQSDVPARSASRACPPESERPSSPPWLRLTLDGERLESIARSDWRAPFLPNLGGVMGDVSQLSTIFSITTVLV